MKRLIVLLVPALAMPVRAQVPDFPAQLPAAAVAEYEPHVVDGLHDLMRVYLAAVDSERRVEEGLALVGSLRSTWLPAADSTLHPRLQAYQGALLVLRAKHAFWPHQKLSHVRSGLGLLDRAVEAAPGIAMIRYLRLVSGFHLPGWFGRGNEVEADFSALAHLLPDAATDFPGDMHAAVTRFVLDHGDLLPEHRARLETIAANDGGVRQ